MAKNVTLVIQVKMRWWLRLYLYGVVFTSYITGMSPDRDKVTKWMRRGMKMRLGTK